MQRSYHFQSTLPNRITDILNEVGAILPIGAINDAYYEDSFYIKQFHGSARVIFYCSNSIALDTFDKFTICIHNGIADQVMHTKWSGGTYLVQRLPFSEYFDFCSIDNIDRMKLFFLVSKTNNLLDPGVITETVDILIDDDINLVDYPLIGADNYGTATTLLHKMDLIPGL